MSKCIKSYKSIPLEGYSWMDVLNLTCSLSSVEVYKQNRGFSDLLWVQTIAAVNAGLTGSADRASPWRCCVDVDRSQKTLINIVT